MRLRNEIFYLLKNTLSKIKKYYFENDIYEEDFFFINRINLKLNTIFDKINEYFTEDKFSLFQAEFLSYSLNELQKYNEKKSNELEKLYELS